MTRILAEAESLRISSLLESQKRPGAAFSLEQDLSSRDYFPELTKKFYKQIMNHLPVRYGSIHQSVERESSNTLTFDAQNYIDDIYEWQLSKSSHNPNDWPVQNRLWRLTSSPNSTNGKLITLDGQYRFRYERALGVDEIVSVGFEIAGIINSPAVLDKISRIRQHRIDALSELITFEKENKAYINGKGRMANYAKDNEYMRLEQRAKNVGFVTLGNYRLPSEK